MEELIPTFCLIRQIEAQAGMRKALIANFEAMKPYVADVGGYSIFEDAADANSIWILDFWRGRDDYDAALQNAELKDILNQQRALIANVTSRAEIKIPT